MKKMICLFLMLVSLALAVPAYAESPAAPNLGILSPSSVLMEASTGRILYENNADEQRPIASVTKIMTMLLIMEAIDEGKINYDTMVPVSERAMSMGGSTMFLEAGEQLSVHDMLKGIAVASANDGCVAMAECLAGSESAFVEMMNARAQQLGMANTHFINTNGLDDENHYSSARDVALMSRELLTHPDIFQFTTIWTDSLRDGKFQLANTNKLIRFYEGANGLKTGSTSQAKCCLSGAAKRDGMQLIAVVLGAPNSKQRFNDARALLDYGFASYSVKELVREGDVFGEATVQNGLMGTVQAVAKSSYSYLSEKGKDDSIEQEIQLTENLRAPVYHGDLIGTIQLKKDGQIIGQTDLIAAETIEAKSFLKNLRDNICRIFA